MRPKKSRGIPQPKVIVIKCSDNDVTVSLKGFGKDPGITVIDARGQIVNYINHGQVGAMGENASATNTQQAWQSFGGQIDMPELAIELEKLRSALAREASSDEHWKAVSGVIDACEAAKNGDGPSTLEKLKVAGQWVLGVAEKNGVDIAVTALKKALGL